MNEHPISQVDLTDCDREPIHSPGAIQPHGVMLVADRTSQEIVHAAGDVARLIGRKAWLGRTLGEMLDDAFAGDFGRLTSSVAVSNYCGRWRAPGGVELDVSAHVSDPWLIVELEPAQGAVTAAQILSELEAAALAFERASSVQALCERAAVTFRRLIGYDRVMVYQFLDDGAGAVLAEDRSEDLPSFLHHHFPGSDIPVQARALYVRNLVRVIPDIRYTPAPMFPPLGDAAELDMSDCVLRSVSPIHLQYMRNMDVGASASVSIVKDGVLWGLIACHHSTPKLLPYDIRGAARALAGGLARQIKAKEEAEAYRERIRLRSFEDDIAARLGGEGSLDAHFAESLPDLRRMLSADGVAILRAGELMTLGELPHESDVRAVADWALKQPAAVVASHTFEKLYPPAATFRERGAGVVATTVSVDEPCVILWFRAEEIEHVNWAGNPHKAVNVKPGEQLTPRTSFEAWSETVRGVAQRWTAAEVEGAQRLRNAILDVRQRRRLRELNQRLTETVADKEALLGQKEILLKEVNHRVQNSLQLVSSFLGLQSRELADERMSAAFEEARRRLGAVALVHRRLYRGDQIETVDLSRYLEELVEEMSASMGAEWAGQIRLGAAPILIATDKAVTLGLILTELVINANKYAYAGAPGPIEITLEQHRNDLRLIVADQGRGKASSSEGFGSRMLKAMVGQLEGRLENKDNKPGLRTIVTCPIG
ncbi:MAG: GAF domain-containing protein [Caulobacteraceae bacterium]|nr:GAF domain-containing protein [Caulobacteraceae bacterium]